jgi:hypothetical protein
VAGVAIGHVPRNPEDHSCEYAVVGDTAPSSVTTTPSLVMAERSHGAGLAAFSRLLCAAGLVDRRCSRIGCFCRALTNALGRVLRSRAGILEG